MKPRAKKGLAPGFADYGGEEPTFVIDLPRVEAEDRRPPHIPDRWRQPGAAHERKVTGYARVKTTMTFHVGSAFVDLAEGEVIELLAPSDYETTELEHWEQKNQQHVVVRWKHGVALVLGRDIERVTIDEWRKQA